MAGQGQRTAYEVLEVRDNASQTVIDAAFRALAGLYHPDRNGSPAAAHRMAELNRAYALIRTTDRRQVYDRLHTPVSSPVPAAPIKSAATSPPKAPQADVLDFGRYAGWSLRDLALRDPDYLRWLSRHSSGIRHRQRIVELLATPPAKTASERLRTR
jgi:curved DNA-binding protein CbpA